MHPRKKAAAVVYTKLEGVYRKRNAAHRQGAEPGQNREVEEKEFCALWEPCGNMKFSKP